MHRTIGSGWPIASWPAGSSIAILAVLAAAIRLHSIAAQSFWVDELFSITHIRNGFAYIWTTGFTTETNPPLYYSLLWGWTSLFGDGEYAARALSAALSAVTVIVVFDIGRLISDRRTGHLAAALFAVSALQVEYAQDARPYALMVLALSLALDGAVRAVRDGEAQAQARPRGGGLFAAGMTAAIYTQSVSVFYWLATNLSLLAYSLVIGRKDPRSRQQAAALARWALLWDAAIFVLVVPQLHAMYVQRGSGNLAWIPDPTISSLLRVFVGVVFTQVSPDRRLNTLVVILAALGIAGCAVANRRRPLVTCMGLILPVVAAAAITAVSLFRPILLVRTAVWLAVPLYVFVAAAIAGMRLRGPRVTALALALGFQIAGLGVYWTVAAKQPWRVIVPEVASMAGPNDGVVFLSAEVVPAFAYYWPGGFDFRRCRLLAFQGPPHEFVPNFDGTARCRTEVSLASLRDRLRRGETFWLVARGQHNGSLLDTLSADFAKGFAVWRAVDTGPDQVHIARVTASEGRSP